MSQVERLKKALDDGRPHRSDELVGIVYGSSHLGLARLGARVHDLKGRLPVGHEIKGWRDPNVQSLWWYQLTTPEVQQGRLAL